MAPSTNKLEARTREEIDTKLVSAGWIVKDKKRVNLHQTLGVAVREFETDTGPADYMLFIAGKACGIIEAKRKGTSLGHFAEQAARCTITNSRLIQRWLHYSQSLHLISIDTKREIRFRDDRDPNLRSRNVYHFLKPETLLDWLREGDAFGAQQQLPNLKEEGLGHYQFDAMRAMKVSLKQDSLRALLQKAAGVCKTFSAYAQTYRLAKLTKAEAELFPVDRSKLALNQPPILLDLKISL